MTAKEIQALIDNFPLYSTWRSSDAVGQLLFIIEAMNERIAELERNLNPKIGDLANAWDEAQNQPK